MEKLIDDIDAEETEMARPAARAVLESPKDPEVPEVELLFTGLERQVQRPGAERAEWLKPGQAYSFPALDAEATVKKWPKLFRFKNIQSAVGVLVPLKRKLAAAEAAHLEWKKKDDARRADEVKAALERQAKEEADRLRQYNEAVAAAEGKA